MELITQLIEEGDPEKIASYMIQNGLIFHDGKILPHPEKVDWVDKQIFFWDQRQHAR